MSLLSRELDYFLSICETRNLARAAYLLGISQPALTRSVQRLESRLATRLFVRAPRGVELTPIGAALRARVEKARTVLSDAERETEQLSAGKIGKVRIGAGHLPSRLVSRALFPRLLVERPAAQLDFHVAFNAELFELLESGRLDLAVCGLLDSPPPTLVFRELIATDLLVVVRRDHPLTKIRKPTMRDLAKYRAAAPVAGVRARQIIEQRMRQMNLSLQSHAIETNSWDALMDAVASTDLFSLAPMHPVFSHSWERRLVALDIPELKVANRTGVVTRSDGYLSPLAIRAIELIELSVTDNEGRGRAARR